MKKIPLTNSKKFALVDSKYYKSVIKYRWYLNTTLGYAQRVEKPQVLLHLFLRGKAKNGEWDHWNRNKLDNQCINMRDCSSSQNKCNSPKRPRNTSGYKGVNWHTPSNKWRAKIAFKGKSYYLGVFTSKIEAAITYNEAAKRLHGEYARLNVLRFPRKVQGHFGKTLKEKDTV